MHKKMPRILASFSLSLALAALTALLASAQASAQCPVSQLTSGLRRPIGVTQSNHDNLIVSETGTPTPNTGRISIVDLSGNRRTLLDGLPSGISDVGDPSGPDGLFLRGRTLYVAIGVGDVGRAGPLPRTIIPNPNPISSPIFSSILAIHFSANVEKTAGGFALTLADQHTLAGGEKVTLSNGNDHLTVELIANFPDYTATPLPTFPGNITLSNPFGLVVVGDQLYVTDGGQNMVRQVDIPSGAISTLVTFPNIPNPLFPVGPPVEEAVPTGIRHSGGQLLVTLFRGVPFAPGTSVVEQVDPLTGDHSPFITGLKTAIDVLPIRKVGDTDYLVLQNASVGPFFASPGLVERFETPSAAPTVIANCLDRPTSMTLDEKTGTLYVSELLTGRIVSIPLGL